MKREEAIHLLQKYNEGTASQEEMHLVENWYANQFIDQQQQESEHLDYIAIKDEMWSSITDTIIVNRQETPVRKINFWKYAVAASILVLMFATLMWKGVRSFHDGQMLAQDSIIPGKNMALLTLADGRKIDLNALETGETLTDNEVIINKSADGVLTYRVLANEEHSSTAFNTIEAPRGGKWQVILPDGSKVYLNALSSLRYPVRFDNNERTVTLKGEGYFEVAHQAQVPFKVHAGGQIVEVLGTHFNISAYAEDRKVKTTLISGSVKVSLANNQSVLLQPGKQAESTATNLVVNDKVDVEDVVAWTSNYFKFNENLKGVMDKISRWYDVDVVYEINPDPTFTYKGEISRDKNIQEILDMLAYFGNATFKIEGRRIIVTK